MNDFAQVHNGWKRACRIETFLIELLILLVLFFLGYIAYDQYYLNHEVDRFSGVGENNYATFLLMREKNPEVVAWINIDNTAINYPVLQAADNEKYMALNPDGESSPTGSIFLDYKNSADFTDLNSILYGHNMAGNRMFGSVKNFEDPDYFKNHQTGTIYLPGKKLTLEIVSYFQANAYDQTVYQVPYQTDEQKAAFQQYVVLNQVNGQYVPVEGERLISLSTCTVNEENMRHILLCRVVEETSMD